MIGALSCNGELGLRLTGLNELSFSCRNRDAQRAACCLARASPKLIYDHMTAG